MTAEAEREYRAEQISRTFALLTAKLEDAATLAVDGQGPQPDKTLVAVAQQIADLASEAATIAGALAALLSTEAHQHAQGELRDLGAGRGSR